MPTFPRVLPVRWLVSCASSATIFCCALLAAANLASAEDWPFTPLKAPKMPPTATHIEADVSIDSFVLAEQLKKGFDLAPTADRLTLIRRVTFDLTGSLPTPEECDEYLANQSPDAYEQVVDRLLNSPGFGERWAQHWLDVVRYADTDGFKLDRTRFNAYRYRDYVIRAFNSDLPYDKFLQQQIAGDELAPNNSDAQVATGFLRLPPEEINGSDYRQIRQEMLDDITDVVGQSFLGLTVGCARCHDHKFDPISQREYFQLQAFFAPLVQQEKELIVDGSEQDLKYEHDLDAWEDATEKLRQKMDAMTDVYRPVVFEELVPGFDDETQAALKLPVEKREPRAQQLAALAGKQLQRSYARMFRRLPEDKRAEYEDLMKQLSAFDNVRPQPLPIAMAAADVGSRAPATHCLEGGDYKKPGEEVQPGFLAVLSKESPHITPPLDRPNSTGRRAALARWLTQPNHPLTARVMVNRLWQHYFGTGIVGTPNNFGVMGESATNPQLLDHLAASLVMDNWQLKDVHRQIVSSHVYRQSSIAEQNGHFEQAEKVDPENDLLWHAPLRRRDAESLRDAALIAAEDTSPQMYGPAVMPELPEAVQGDRYAWQPSAQASAHVRRSVYLFVKRNLQYPLFASFDHPNRVTPCAARPSTIGAPQALLLLNGEFLRNTSRHMAGDLLIETKGTPVEIVTQAYDRVFNRSPEPAELQAALTFLREQSQRIAQHGSPDAKTLPDPLPAGYSPAQAAAIVDFCQSLMNSAEFVYVD
ncbi:DUF1549 and DUF1553 domain-containing protein [Anatilimnocola floriformis]|uniref:DUF1549 and DUF1553 domain-containing protein n=1 Tax=Anatilimnocola floriformis TaxID=2948575 RepID=UPI0020C29CB9|nr:DUF1549 and DUF1553 domain-containing protein [Anatilimnocola floriformis]